MKTKAVLMARINSYLGAGGLFNPEYMEHEKVRDLLIDIGDWLTADAGKGYTECAGCQDSTWEHHFTCPHRLPQVWNPPTCGAAELGRSQPCICNLSICQSEFKTWAAGEYSLKTYNDEGLLYISARTQRAWEIWTNAWTANGRLKP